jgi:hypothetical protein
MRGWAWVIGVAGLGGGWQQGGAAAVKGFDGRGWPELWKRMVKSLNCAWEARWGRVH